MAARKTKIRHDGETRAKIQTSQLINRLQDHVFGKVDLSQTQVRAALGLMAKTLPDLTSTTLSGDKDNPIAIQETGSRELIAERIAGIAANAPATEDISGPH